MNTDLQKAGLGKRFIAAIFDGILLSIIAVGLAALLSSAFGYDGYMNSVNKAYAKYESEYGIEFQITENQYNELSEQKRADYDAAYKALTEDESVTYAYNMLINLTLLIMTLSILVAVIVVDFAVPLFFKNGQTLGKKIFGIALMHTDGIQVSPIQLFARTVLGKFAFELIIPLNVIMMIFFNFIGITGALILLILLIAEIICLAVTRTNSFLHDAIAGTVAVDFSSQKIFKNREELIEHTKALHLERAERSTY